MQTELLALLGSVAAGSFLEAGLRAGCAGWRRVRAHGGATAGDGVVSETREAHGPEARKQDGPEARPRHAVEAALGGGVAEPASAPVVVTRPLAAIESTPQQDESRILLGDALTLLATLADNSVDACVTDPPYGIGFMGQAWDTFKPGYRPDAWPGYETDPRVGSGSMFAGKYDRSDDGIRGYQQWCEEWAGAVLRVLKPGGHLIASNSPRMYHRMAAGIEDAGFEIRDQIMWVFGSGFPKSYNLTGKWDGWGTALKPGMEPIVLARKPLSEKSVAANVARWGTGALNIEASRVGGSDGNKGGSGQVGGGIRDGRIVEINAGGRWPANVAHDGSEAVAAAFPDDGRGGSAARFFYCAKASRADREDGLDGLNPKMMGFSGGAQTHGAGYDKGQGVGLNRVLERRNTHPTVKPTALMRWLIRLVTPAGGVVLDPFAGSGSTGKAAILERCRFIGVEREAEYVTIAKARLAHAGEAAPKQQAAAAKHRGAATATAAP